MAIRPFSSVPQAVAEVNLTVPSVATVTTVEQSYDPASIPALRPFQPHMTLLVNATGASLSGASAFPTGLGIVNAFVSAADGLLYIRFVNPTAGSLGGSACTFKILGL